MRYLPEDFHDEHLSPRTMVAPAQRLEPLRPDSAAPGQCSSDGSTLEQRKGLSASGRSSLSCGKAFDVERATGFDERPFQRVTDVVELLEVAHAEFERDREAAKASIAHATRILRGALERDEAFSKADGCMGGLAGWQVQRLQVYIDSHLGETIQISDLGRVVHRSAAHLCRAFKVTFRQTPHAYVTARRLERAKSLMLESDEQLSIIAALCGFADQSHLSTRFRQQMGESPGAWRRRALFFRELAIPA